MKQGGKYDISKNGSTKDNGLKKAQRALTKFLG
jgi:hypothetical protein